jgi:pyridoxamine 5'-phosphate oxidase
MVLLKDWDTKGFRFYTNSLSQKGKQLSRSPVAAVNFFWDVLHRQIRIRGDIEELSVEKADAYFASRHPKSQIGAWASAQSQELPSREVFEKRMEDFEKKFAGQVIPRPEYWKGYCLMPKQIEFWQHRDNRLHDRFRYLLVDGKWEVKRLFP